MTPPLQLGKSAPDESGRLTLATIAARPGNRGESWSRQSLVHFSAAVEKPAVTHAVILVGGIHETSHYFDRWVPALASPDTVVFDWGHNHQSMSMGEGAKLLAARISELRTRGITGVTIVAHSMGGLIAKGAIDELSRNGEAQDVAHLEIWVFGTPWVGYALADLASFFPAAETISFAIGYPMGPDIGPHSDYMRSLAQPMPANGVLRIYLGTDDERRPHS